MRHDQLAPHFVTECVSNCARPDIVDPRPEGVLLLWCQQGRSAGLFAFRGGGFSTGELYFPGEWGSDEMIQVLNGERPGGILWAPPAGAEVEKFLAELAATPAV